MNPNRQTAETGFLLLNLGTPDQPKPPAVKRYLQEFLMDPYVVDIPFALRWILVHLIITPRRSKTSAEAYQSIWEDRGSPLLIHTLDLAEKVQDLMGDQALVETAMRYGNPSVPRALETFRLAGIKKLVAIPLYPQYSLAATESSVDWVKKNVAKNLPNVELKFIEEFFNEDAFLDAVVEKIQDYRSKHSFDHFLFSYHGLPEHQVKKTDPTGAYCLQEKNCCEKKVEANQHCYRHQCFETTKLLAEKCQIPKEDHSISFQSRLGRRPWIKPYTDFILEDIAKKGNIKHLAVVCPSFVADCLETLEEIQIRTKEQWQEVGGEDLTLIPCPNASDKWAKGVTKLFDKNKI